MSTTHTLRIAALSVPVVYNDDGDHDPDGMIFAMQGHVPLLEWLRRRWDEDGGRLPRLHLRRQRYQVVADALTRLEPMLAQLRRGDPGDRGLLLSLQLAELDDNPPALDDARAGSGPDSAHATAARLHIESTLSEIRSGLASLGRSTGPAPQGAGPDEGPVDAAPARSDRMPIVTLTAQQRGDLLARCEVQIVALDRALRRWHDDAASDPARRFDAEALAAAGRGRLGELGEEGDLSSFDGEQVQRLMANASSRTGATSHDVVDPLRPVPLVAPLTLRVRLGDVVHLDIENRLQARDLVLDVQGDGLTAIDDAPVDEALPPGARRVFGYRAHREGVWPINDIADLRGGETGTNVHGLFAVLIVEPAGVTWHDPQTGADLTDSPFGAPADVDVHVPDERLPAEEETDWEYVDLHRDGLRSHREFTVFLHDEPEVHSGLHVSGEHSVMPLSYRAEPMPNRLPHRARRLADATAPLPPPGQSGVDRAAVSAVIGPDLEEQFWTARTPDGRYLERVAGEEQHHSSWLFGDPATPILRAYRGDPCRVRLVHAGVKETHVWHLHVHQWRLVPADGAAPSVHGVDESGHPRAKGSQIVDAVTIGPQTAVTIDPLYGSGSRQQAVGDIIWHCHLYPHFHHGMWGLWRSFDRLVDGSRPYPDGRPCPALQPLPGRTPSSPVPTGPGFPWFVDGTFPMKSPPPPALRDDERCGRRRLLRLPAASATERAAMAAGCIERPQPGALFTDLDALARRWNAAAGLPAPRLLSYDVEVVSGRIDYNVDGWHDPRGHRYRLLRASVTTEEPDGTSRTVTHQVEDDGNDPEPFFARANHGDIVELRLHNSLGSFAPDGFDLAQAPVECGLHVHLVKFDVLAADGSSTGWNYLSGASCREAVGPQLPGERSPVVSLHRWVVDEEFGPCFFHDHLLANFRQKHGLYAALVAEPHGSQWLLPERVATEDEAPVEEDDEDETSGVRAAIGGDEEDRPRPVRATAAGDVSGGEIAWCSAQAVIVPPATSGLPPYREACLGIADFVPLLDAGGRPLNPPGALSGDDDPGSMAVSYRCAPLTLRGDDPSRWFATSARSRRSMHGTPGDPDTPVVEAYPGERIRIRLVQGSHEEQHSFVAAGLRWRRDWGSPTSALVAQQTLGISEAFTLDIDPATDCPTGPGDHLYRFSPIDDVWTGCWGFVRILDPGAAQYRRVAPLPRSSAGVGDAESMLSSLLRPPRGPDGSYGAQVRTYVVVARRTEHRYDAGTLTDPWGLVLRCARYEQADEAAARRDGTWPPVTVDDDAGPLVLRARRGEWVRVILVNELVSDDDEDRAAGLPPLGVEPSPPRLPLESLDARGVPDSRTMSPRVSLHPSLLLRDVRSSDGSAVGRNPDQTVAHRFLSQAAHLGDGHASTGGVVVHGHGGDRHSHDEPNYREYFWHADELLAPASHTDGPGQVCLLEDLADVRNHRHHGLFGALVVLPGDVTPVDGDGQPRWTGAEADLVDDGGAVVAHDATVFVQDGLRLFVNGHPSLPVPDVVPDDDPEDSGHKALSYRSGAVRRGAWEPGEPLVSARRGVPLWLRVLGAGDKPRQHSLTLQGHAWAAARHVADGPWTGSISGIAPGFSDTVVVDCERSGDYRLRSGAFRWGTELGVIATVRVAPDARPGRT